MNPYHPDLLTSRRWASILCGLLLAAATGFYFFDVSAQTEAVEKPAEQNLTLGRLAFSSRVVGPTVPVGRIITANPDASGWSALPSSSPVPFASEPAWSPDGTKLAFSWTQSPEDLYVINADGSGQANLTNTTSIREKNPSWSVTGKIAYERDPNTTNGQIWVMNPDGSGNVQFSGITQPFPTSPVWSPDGTKLAFTSGGEIWVINADGTNERRVTMNATTDSDPAWSPDGSKFVFGKSGSGIAVINTDGTNEIGLGAIGTQPSWSPDGTKIAFTRNGIYTMDANGGNQVRIVANSILFPQCCDTIYENPAWQPVPQTPNTFNINGRVTNNNNVGISGVTVNLSGTANAAVTTDAVGNYQFSGLPGGGSYTVSPSFINHYFTPPNRSFNDLSSNQIADFSASRVCAGLICAQNGKIAFVRNGEIFTMNSDGANQTNITNNPAADAWPNYSPDGSKIIFTRGGDIYRMDADGSNPVPLTNNSTGGASPDYSPDGSSIVFWSNRDGNNEIYKMNADGTNQVRLTNTATSESYPAFSPDGQKIVYVYSPAPSPGPMKLFTMNADGSNQQPLPDSGGGGNFYDRPSYSPDGSKIIMVYGPDVTMQTIWTMNADGTNRAQFPTTGRSPSYSPDGTKVTLICCTGDFTSRVWTTNANGGSPGILTPSNNGNDMPVWQPVSVPRRTAFDFDGDGRSDISVFRPSNGAWYLLRSTAGLWVPVWGLSTDVLVPADFDGDLKTDVAVWRPSDGNFYVLNSFNNTVRIENFGLSGDVPTGGDWDGDGKADPAVYRPGAQSTFYYRGSMGNPQGNITFLPWGVSGDKPVVADYDGDSRTDAAVYRNGTWYIRQSSNGQLAATSFGVADDVLIPADYDADGKADQAVYRNGIWYLLRSTQGFAAFQFGVSTDIPSPADYDGDGRADAAIFRDGVWWILKTQTGTTDVVSFGSASDKPVPSAFVQ